jgi:peptidoglycan hydrolase CwlO-like protein
MDVNLILGAIQIVSIIIMAALAWSRLPHQNIADTSTSVKNLSDSLDSALKRQKELETEQDRLECKVRELNNILKEKTYSVTMIFQLGEKPVVQSVVIQPVSVKPYEQVKGE